jgi:hypothetical protein
VQNEIDLLGKEMSWKNKDIAECKRKQSKTLQKRERRYMMINVQ